MLNLRRGVAFAICALMLVLIARPAQADDTLVLLDGGPGANIYDTLRFVAQSMGYFKQQHVNVDETYTGSSLTAAQLVATGKGDVLASTIEPILEGYEKGLRFQVFFTRSSHYAYVLAVLADSPIRTLADFKGATIGETNVSSSAEVATNSMLAGAGLKRSDYSYLPIGAGAQALQAIVDKRVTGVAFPYDLLAQYEIAGGVKFRFFKHPILQAGNSVYSALPGTIQAKADVFRRFTRAITEAAVYTHYHPHEVARMYLEGAGLKITDKALADQEQLLVLCKDYIAGADPSNERIGSTSLRDTELYSRVLVAAGMATQVVPAAAVVTDQFVGYANAFDRKPLSTR
jgi:ABC-type nitrate/sulfonate/bicarbonate transport system substrate-binding protein